MENLQIREVKNNKRSSRKRRKAIIRVIQYIFSELLFLEL